MAKRKNSTRSMISSPENSNDFYFTASQLLAFYQCPAKYAFSRRLASHRDPSTWIRDGNEAHAIMARKGEMVQGSSRRASKLAARAWRHIQKSYSIISTEWGERLSVHEGFVLLRTIDALAEDDKGRVVLDYKFTGQQWDTIPELNDLAPRAAGFQAKCYLIPSMDDWPTRIHFIVIDDYGLETYKYERQPDDLQEVMKAAKLMKYAWDSQLMPKNRGYLCHTYCDFRDPCFGVKDWEVDFDERDNNPYKRDIRYRDEDDL